MTETTTFLLIMMGAFSFALAVLVLVCGLALRDCPVPGSARLVLALGAIVYGALSLRFWHRWTLLKRRER